MYDLWRGLQLLHTLKYGSRSLRLSSFARLARLGRGTVGALWGPKWTTLGFVLLGISQFYFFTIDFVGISVSKDAWRYGEQSY